MIRNPEYKSAAHAALDAIEAAERKEQTVKVSNGDFTVVGIDGDGCLLCRDDATGETYNCGDTLEEFGLEYLSPAELAAIGGA